MDSETFIQAVERHVRDAAIAGTIAKLKRPVGQRFPRRTSRRVHSLPVGASMRSDVSTASKAANLMLKGVQLDSIRVYSIVIQLGFVRLREQSGLPGVIWVTATGAVTLNPNAWNATEPADSTTARGACLPALHALIGEHVTHADVSEGGILRIALRHREVLIAPEEDNLEEVWTVSESPVAGAASAWLVALEDTGDLAVRVPSGVL